MKIYRENTRCWTYSSPNQESDLRLKNHIFEQLKLLKRLAGSNTRIIVAPVTPNPLGYVQFNDDYKESLLKVNAALKNTSNKLGFEFLDTQTLLDRPEHYVDNCCHLSQIGAELVVDQLVNFVKRTNNVAIAGEK